MRPMRQTAWLICLLAMAALQVTRSASAANTTAKLLLSDEVARPGQTVWAGVQLRMSPGWHTYWRNGGDSGAPTTIQWTLPAGVTAGPIEWPVPELSETAG